MTKRPCTRPKRLVWNRPLSCDASFTAQIDYCGTVSAPNRLKYRKRTFFRRRWRGVLEAAALLLLEHHEIERVRNAILPVRVVDQPNMVIQREQSINVILNGAQLQNTE